jgi:hypothetical protein
MKCPLCGNPEWRRGESHRHGSARTRWERCLGPRPKRAEIKLAVDAFAPLKKTESEES